MDPTELSSLGGAAGQGGAEDALTSACSSELSMVGASTGFCQEA